MEKSIYLNQVVATIVQEQNIQQEHLYIDKIIEIQLQTAEKIQMAEKALGKSQVYIENVRDFISDPKHILGTMTTKHGEIAEHIQVEISNAIRAMKHLSPNATFEGVGRTAPEDYLIENLQVQSKFINSANKSLDAVLKHINSYPNITSNNGYYQIPKDQFETIQKILNGDETPNISYKTIEKCKNIVEQIEKKSGKSFTKVVKPGISNYKDVQINQVDKTLNNYQKQFTDQHHKEIKAINAKKEIDIENAQQIKEVSWGDAGKVGVICAIITGTTMASIKIYSKIHSGKKITEFSLDDWKDIGYDFSIGGAKGGISGIAIYLLTKKKILSAPFAGAVVSTTIGVATLARKYQKGELTKQEYSESVCSLSVEAGFSAIGAAIGQGMIPIPIVGAVIGTAISKSALEITKYIMGKKEKELILQLEEEYNSLVSKFNQETMENINKIISYFERLGGYISAALSPVSAVRLYGSIELCRILNVPETEVIHNTKELDDFILL